MCCCACAGGSKLPWLMTSGREWRRRSVPNEASYHHHRLLLIPTHTNVHTGCEHIYTHTTHVFNPLQPHSASTPTEIRPARVELNQSGTIARSLARSQIETFFVCVLLLFCCVFLFVCFLILFFAAPAVRTPRRVGRRWAPCQEMMSWPASPLTLVCVFDTLVLFRCDCAVPDATARVCMCACGLHLWRVCVCGRILHSVCVHEEIVPQQL